MLSRQWRWVCLVLATATVVGVVAAHKAASTGRGRYRALLKNLLAVSANSRSTEARITGFLQWNPAPEALRGGSSSIPGDVHIAALLLRDAVGLAEDVEELRSAACAHLALGDALAAVEALEEAALISPETASIRADLSGALYEQWRQGGQSIDLVRAVEESSIALMRDPLSKEAAFNQALSLSGLKLRRAAEGAWTRFLHIDGTSPWAVEARARRSAVLTKDAQWTPPSEHGSDAEMDRVVAGAATSVYRFIELELERWSAAVLSGSGLRFDVAERLANALARSGADAYLAAVWRDVRMSEHWPAQRRRALALGMRQVLRWRALIDAGAYAAAEPVAAEAHDALRAAGFDTVEADLEIGYSDFVAGRTAAALTRLAQVEARGRRGGFWRIAAKAIRLQGLSAALATRVSEAQAHYEAGSVLAERSGDAELQVLFDTFLGETLGQQGDMRAAWRLLTRTLPWLPDLSLMRQRFDVLNACANAARRTGLDHTSMLFAGEMLEAMSGWPNPEGRIVGHFLRARGMAHLGVGDRGVRDLDAAASLVEQLADRPQAQARLKAEVNAYRAYSFAGHDDRAARAAASEAIAYFSDAVQLRLAELLLQRGRIHERLGDLPGAVNDWRRGIDVIEDQRPAIQNELLRIARTAASWDLYAELIDHERLNPRAALLVAERARARELVYSLAPGQRPERLSLDAVQRMLSDDGQALVFTQLRDRLLIWLVDRNGISLTERPVSSLQVRRATRRFIRSLDTDGPNAAGDELARILLPPAISYRSDRPLILVPDQALYAVPFAALPVPGRSQRLVEAVIPVVSPSLASFGLASARAGQDPAPPVLVVGVAKAVQREALPALPRVEREAADVFASYAGRGRLLVGEAASRSAVAGAIPSALVIHFAGHAIFDPLFPARSRLLVSDGALTLPDLAVAGLRPGAVAVLSACETASGQTYRGEGPISVVRTFLGAGASAVIATLWKVRDDDAADIMPTIHGFLSHGRAAAESLALSQRQRIASHAPPSSWAGFVAYGGVGQPRKD